MKKIFLVLSLVFLFVSCQTTETIYDIDFPSDATIDTMAFWIDGSADPLGIASSVAEELSGYGFTTHVYADAEDIGKLGSVSGTAFAISSDLLVTNSHVVGEADKVTVVIDGKDVEAEVLVNETDADLAVLRVPVTLPYSFILADDVKKGEHVTVIGYPYTDIMGKESKVTEGIVSSLTGLYDTVFRFQFSAEIQPGNSGGPVFNDDFMVVGIATESLSDAYTFENDGFVSQNANYAVKEDIIRYVAEGLITHDESYSVDSMDEALQAVFMVKADETADVSDDVLLSFDYTYDYNLPSYDYWSGRTSGMYFVDPIVFSLYTMDGTKIGEVSESSYAGSASVSESAYATAEYAARHIFYSFAEKCLPRTNTGEAPASPVPLNDEAAVLPDDGGTHGSRYFM